MKYTMMLGLYPAAIALLFGVFCGCKPAKELIELRRKLADPRLTGPPHERLEWKAEDFFSDPGVVSLCKAIEAKDLAEIDRLAKSGVDVKAKGRGNMTPLLWAYPAGETVFKKLLDLGADPNVKFTEEFQGAFLKGMSVTIASVATQAFGIVHGQYFHDIPMQNYLKLVLEHGGDPNIEDIIGETPIFYTRGLFLDDRRRSIKLLLDAGADINHRNWCGQTATTAVPGGGYDSVLSLLEAGADYRLAENSGNDLITRLEWRKMSWEREPTKGLRITSAGKPLLEWLTNEGVDWTAARAALESPETGKNLKSLPADYEHRPWLPQRPTLKKPDVQPGKQ